MKKGKKLVFILGLLLGSFFIVSCSFDSNIQNKLVKTAESTKTNNSIMPGGIEETDRKKETEDLTETDTLYENENQKETETEKDSDRENLSEVNNPTYITLGFAGDFNLCEDYPTTKALDNSKNGIYDCIDPDLIKELNEIDLFMLNNEFTFSEHGEKMAGKKYTFRASPKRVSVLKELGVDIVLLANNHVFDYGEEAFLDTMQTLKDAEIDAVGAGINESEAKKPVYYQFGDITIAYVAATRAEKHIMTPEATTQSPGVLRCYDETLFLAVIKEASLHADYVIASVHFGDEYHEEVSDEQRELAMEMIDAGADAVIGSHAHVIQGIQFYNEKPIVYNLGNFWFNNKDLYSCVVELKLCVNEENSNKVTLDTLTFLPCTQYDCYTDWVTEGKERDAILTYEEEISEGIILDEDGCVRRKDE